MQKGQQESTQERVRVFGEEITDEEGIRLIARIREKHVTKDEDGTEYPNLEGTCDHVFECACGEYGMFISSRKWKELKDHLDRKEEHQREMEEYSKQREKERAEKLKRRKAKDSEVALRGTASAEAISSEVFKLTKAFFFGREQEAFEESLKRVEGHIRAMKRVMKYARDSPY